ncbi:MAG: dienelactone hydrolase family protein [Firmicutes bacterium]|nr:dienelactone hydrolase family protein [Bacillota bacterium]
MSGWNKFNVSDYSGMIAETISIPGHGGRYIHAYYSRPTGEGKFPGLLLIPHMPGWDEYCRETARRFSEHGYSVLCPNIYEDFGDGTPGEVTMRMREIGMVHDSSVMEDCACALSFLHNQVNANDKVGVIGMCSGGRHTFLAACTLNGVDAAVDCWGGGVVVEEDGSIYSCDHFVDNEHRLGNLASSKLSTLASSQTQIILGNSKKALLIQECKSCPYLNLCGGGCLKDRFNEESGQYFLCSGMKKFFSHAVPVLNEAIKLSIDGMNAEEIKSRLSRNL